MKYSNLDVGSALGFLLYCIEKSYPEFEPQQDGENEGGDEQEGSPVSSEFAINLLKGYDGKFFGDFVKSSVITQEFQPKNDFMNALLGGMDPTDLLPVADGPPKIDLDFASALIYSAIFRLKFVEKEVTFSGALTADD